MGTSVATRPGVSVTELAAQLMAQAEFALNYEGVSLEPDGRDALRQIFTRAADAMVTGHRTTPDDLGEAHHAVGLLARGIVLQARTAAGAAVNAGIIQKVKDFFCPGLWPFC